MLQKDTATLCTYTAGKRSLDKALELLKAKKVRRRKQLKYYTDKYDKIAKYCTLTARLKKQRNPCVIGYTHSFATSQMRSCIARHDWINSQRLIPLLMGYSTDKEPLIWRFALAILLNSPESSVANLLHFLEKCMGSTAEMESDEPNRFLQRLLTLQAESEE
ncbi:uncharacterized protein LOC117177709 isoform X2 [Belonocnema kinseyi]|uniref:uncharacterized protein LOC117177709 isoform X2 n=1 Tax=Belonocnema kinseyi TaxID=2817044 RepID=UPI00143D9D4E|nr:uncharacterized protein LOC117177709 isoform X2 [Belonocnema kinseyi]